MTAFDPRLAPRETDPDLGALERSFQLFDRPGLLELMGTCPALGPALTRLRIAIGACVGPDAVALVDTVRSAASGAVVGVVLMVQPAAGSDGTGYENLVRWWRRRGSSEVRARIALGLLPTRPAANDNAFDDG